MKTSPLASIADGVGSAFGGVLAYLAGLTAGAMIVGSPYAGYSEVWILYPVAGILLIPFLLTSLWGLLFVPFLIVMFFGMLWGEWNRLIGATVVAIGLAIGTFLVARANPFAEWPTTIGFGLAFLALGAGIAWEHYQARPTRPSRNSDEQAGSR